MRIKPMLFNTEMVCALLDGRKTVTRRVVKPQHLRVLDSPYHKKHPEITDKVLLEKLCEPPYRPGDVIYVRETWQFIPCIDCSEGERCNFQPVEYEDKYMVGEGCFVYKADYPAAERICWRPSIHMPRDAARIFLRVTGVRVERLWDMTSADMVKEGMNAKAAIHSPWKWHELWDNTIKPEELNAYGWAANPWVWAIEFERVHMDKDCIQKG